MDVDLTSFVRGHATLLPRALEQAECLATLYRQRYAPAAVAWVEAHAQCQRLRTRALTADSLHAGGVCVVEHAAIQRQAREAAEAAEAMAETVRCLRRQLDAYAVPVFANPVLQQRVREELRVQHSAAKQGGISLHTSAHEMATQGQQVAVIDGARLRRHLAELCEMPRLHRNPTQFAGPPFGLENVRFRIHQCLLARQTLQQYGFRDAVAARYEPLILESYGADYQAIVLGPRSGQIPRTIHLRRNRTLLDSRCVFECPDALPACFALQRDADGEYSCLLPMEYDVNGRRSASWVAPDGERLVGDRWVCVRAALNLGGRFDDPCRCSLTLQSFSHHAVARDDAPWLTAAEAACTSWQTRAAHEVCRGLDRDGAAALCEPLRTHVAVALEIAQQPTLALPREVHATTQKLSTEQEAELVVATLHERAQRCAAAECACWRRQMLHIYSWQVGLHVRVEAPVHYITINI